MVLVDSKQNFVYSAMDRTPSGENLRIGSLGDSGDICWDDDAFVSRQQGKLSRPHFRMHVSKPTLFANITMACVGQISC
jgi:hypothetical protein